MGLQPLVQTLFQQVLDIVGEVQTAMLVDEIPEETELLLAHLDVGTGEKHDGAQ
jgi:hypothetical protein